MSWHTGHRWVRWQRPGSRLTFWHHRSKRYWTDCGVRVANMDAVIFQTEANEPLGICLRCSYAQMLKVRKAAA